jgi:Xaa-Pro aminopeptidase
MATILEPLAANSADEIAARLGKLRIEMQREGLDAVFVGHSTDLEYFAGIERPISTYGRTQFWAGWAIGAVYSQRDRVPFLVSRHFANGHLNERGAPLTAVDVQIFTEDDDPHRVVATSIRDQAGERVRRIGVNQAASADLVLSLRASFPDADIVSAATVLARIRAIKSAAEIEAMTQASLLVDEVFGESLKMLTPSMTEMAFARWIDDQMLERGAIAPAFHTGLWTMGASETRDAKERLSDRPIGTDTSVNYDFGAGYRGYCSDFGRTVFMGEPSARYREAYGLVIASQEEGRRTMKPGTQAKEVNRRARMPIDDGGFGQYFWHRLGHAIGKDTHEAPFLDVMDDTLLEEGMAFTIEPSIFIPGELGCRVEDVFVVTQNGGQRLNKVSAELRAQG